MAAHISGAAGAFLRGNVGKIAAVLAVLLVFSIVLNISARAVIVIPLLMLLASFSTFYFNYVSLPVNFELVKLSTVLAAVSYGFLPGLAVGVTSTFFGKVLIGRIDERLPISMLMISLMAAVASVFGSHGITGLGIALVLAYNLAMLFLSQMIGGDLAWNIPYEASNFLFNIILFAKLAPFMLKLIG